MLIVFPAKRPRLRGRPWLEMVRNDMKESGLASVEAWKRNNNYNNNNINYITIVR